MYEFASKKGPQRAKKLMCDLVGEAENLYVRGIDRPTLLLVCQCSCFGMLVLHWCFVHGFDCSQSKSSRSQTCEFAFDSHRKVKV